MPVRVEEPVKLEKLAMLIAAYVGSKPQRRLYVRSEV